MKKLFTMLSILFALLAGFNACGGSDTGDTDNETKDQDSVQDTVIMPDDSGDDGDPGDTGDTFYGIAYCQFRKIV